MMRMDNRVISTLVSSILLLTGCASVQNTQLLPPSLFGERVILGQVENDKLNEISGLAASRIHPGVIWVHNDSGDSNQVYAMNESGQHLGTYKVSACLALDWEDIAVGPGPDEKLSYLYVGDIGDNRAIRPFIHICRIAEPSNLHDMNSEASPVKAEVIALRYPDGARDAETLMVDPSTKDLYIVTKREYNVFVYRAAFPQSVTEINELEKVAELPLTRITAGDISADGNEVLLKSLGKVFYWRRTQGEQFAEMFKKPYDEVPYRREPQGEAIGWASDASGFYTMSEEPLAFEADVNFYPRNIVE